MSPIPAANKEGEGNVTLLDAWPSLTRYLNNDDTLSSVKGSAAGSTSDLANCDRQCQFSCVG